MKETLREILMNGSQIGLDLIPDEFQALVHAIKRRHHRFTRLLNSGALHLDSITGWRGANLEFKLFEPEAEVGQERLHVGNDDFEIRVHAIKFLPLLQELIE